MSRRETNPHFSRSSQPEYVDDHDTEPYPLVPRRKRHGKPSTQVAAPIPVALPPEHEDRVPLRTRPQHEDHVPLQPATKPIPQDHPHPPPPIPQEPRHGKQRSPRRQPTNQLSTQPHSHSQSTSFSFLRKTPHSQPINFSLSSFHFPRLSLITTKQTLNLTPTHSSTSEQQTEEPLVSEEEFSRTRLLAQNVPWTSTPEDIRTLFEKHGKVLEVEVSFFFLLFFSVLFIFKASVF